MTSKDNDKTHFQELVNNRKATYQYEIIETLETGVVLVGTEIKSLRDHGGSLQDAYVSIEAGQMWLMGSSIAPYRFGNVYNHEERRKRKLLAHKKEIQKFQAAIQEKGMTCVPLNLYIKNGRVKITIALVKGKKLHDKREAIKTRDEKREIERYLKS